MGLSLEQKMLERTISAADDSHIFVVADLLPSDLLKTRFTELQVQLSSSEAAADVETWGGSYGGVDCLPPRVIAVSSKDIAAQNWSVIMGEDTEADVRQHAEKWTAENPELVDLRLDFANEASASK
jgi:hypothetical protein